MYIPKNRLITNLFTYGNELVYKNTKVPYTGYYYKTYSGEFYTGKTPNDLPNNELEEIKNVESDVDFLQPKSSISYVSTDEFTQTLYNNNLILEYSALKKINPEDRLQDKKLPTSYYPSPSASEYKLGTFTRYFVAKINETYFLEVNNNIYSAIKSKNIEWEWGLYIPFLFQWVLIGDKQQVYKTNRNTVKLTEKNLRKKGLGSFLKEDYLQFWKDSSI